MDDLISRHAAIDAVLDRMNVEKHGRDAKPEEIQWALEKLPSAQLEIIRCKDCNHWSRESICDGFCSEDCMRHDEDFYCGYAERRTDEADYRKE